MKKRNVTVSHVLLNALGILGANGVHAQHNLHAKLEYNLEAVNVLENPDVTASVLPKNPSNAVD